MRFKLEQHRKASTKTAKDLCAIAKLYCKGSDKVCKVDTLKQLHSILQALVDLQSKRVKNITVKHWRVKPAGYWIITINDKPGAMQLATIKECF